MDECGRIRVKVELTSVLRIRLKQREIEVMLPAGSTLRHVAEKLASQFGPDVADVIFGAEGKINLRFAVDKRLADLDDVLVDGSEVMVLSQIGGG